MSLTRSRWAAIGAAVAVSLGAGGFSLVSASIGSGERAVYTAIEPCRLLDTRPTEGIGGRTTPLQPDEIYPIDLQNGSDECASVPPDVVAVGLNVTAVFASELTDLRFWAEGDYPNSSSLNPAPGQPPTPNAVTTEVTDAGTFQVRNEAGTVHLIVDLVGIYQDHHHDDRYVTTASGLIPFAFGRVHADGTLGPHEGNVTTKWNSSLLRYEIDVNPGVLEVGTFTNITVVTPADSNCGDHKAVTSNQAGTEYVFMVDSGGSKVQCAFEFVTFRHRSLTIPTL